MTQTLGWNVQQNDYKKRNQFDEHSLWTHEGCFVKSESWRVWQNCRCQSSVSVSNLKTSFLQRSFTKHPVMLPNDNFIFSTSRVLVRGETPPTNAVFYQSQQHQAQSGSDFRPTQRFSVPTARFTFLLWWRYSGMWKQPDMQTNSSPFSNANTLVCVVGEQFRQDRF